MYREEITIDSIYFPPNHKTIISLTDSVANHQVAVTKMKPWPTKYEENYLSQYFMSYKNNFRENYAYVKQNNRIHLLNNPENYFWTGTGPVSYGKAEFTLLDSFNMDFKYEPYYMYEFETYMLKKKQIDKRWFMHGYNSRKPYITDLVLTEKKIRQSWIDHENQQRQNRNIFRIANNNVDNNNKLHINLIENRENNNQLLNIIAISNQNINWRTVYPGSYRIFHNLPEGKYKLIFLYQECRYFVANSLPVKPNGENYYRLYEPDSLLRDSFSMKISRLIDSYAGENKSGYSSQNLFNQVRKEYYKTFSYNDTGNEVSGIVTCENGEPLPGVNVLIKGSSMGTITDINGRYTLKVPPGESVVYSFIGCQTKEVQISHECNIKNISLFPDNSTLDEVVVVGYGISRKYDLTGSISTISAMGIPGIATETLQGRVRGLSSISSSNPLILIDGMVYDGDIDNLDTNNIKKIEVIKDTSATAIYGTKAANGVILVTTKSGSVSLNVTGEKFETNTKIIFPEMSENANSIRNNFSGYAYWQPTLCTDKNGKASFKVKFPDDVTNWETFVLAMNEKQQSGQTKNSIKSFKPLMAQLYMPQFLIENDTSYAIGKIINYSRDSVSVTTTFEANDNTKQQTNRICNHLLLDTLKITADCDDTLELKYYVQKQDGYLDGEKRNIPVFPVGVMQTDGHFFALDNDTSFSITFSDSTFKAILYAQSSPVDALLDESLYISNYMYNCNEQLASKLKALLAEKAIAEYRGDKFKKNLKIHRIINKLKQNQQKTGLWGWWKNSEESIWISLHIAEALIWAKEKGYAVDIDKPAFRDNLICKIETTKNKERIMILSVLHKLSERVDFAFHVKELEKDSASSLYEKFRLIELKQSLKMSYSINSILKYKRNTLLGNIYFDDENGVNSIQENPVMTTIAAYRVLKNDSAFSRNELKKIVNYFFEKRSDGHWQNTFQSTQIIETILLALLDQKSKPVNSSIILKGAVNKTITDFPAKLIFEPTEPLQIEKSGDFPVYLTTYQQTWNSSPKQKTGIFEINTCFNTSGSSMTLTAGKAVILIVNLEVKKDAEYIMLEIPIPAGCSYPDKNNIFVNEAHGEYFKHQVSIFCTTLEKGKYSFKIELLPRYSGSYYLNPAKAELMYFPVFYGMNTMKRVKIRK